MDSQCNIERYDRQIRIWGQHGQNKCSSSKICLINADSLGTEILKCLCLAGIGSFHILDSHKLVPEDLGTNLIPHSCLGKNRGESVKNMLLNLNEEVSGEVHPVETYLPHITQVKSNGESLEDSSIDKINFWKQFNCIVISGYLYIDQISRISKLCWNLNIPLILCKSIGFYGSFRSQYKEHLVIETHPDNELPNFYLDKPFADLKKYFDSINIEDDSNLDKISSYPYVVLVYKYLKLWQEKNQFHDERLPNSFSEKQALKCLIDEGLKNVSRRRKMRKDQELNDNEQELVFENYLEASKAVNSCLANSFKSLPKNVESIFNNPKVIKTTAQNVSQFWLIIKAIREFVMQKNEDRLPVTGVIPDMISSSEEYIKLQMIFSKKARDDVVNIFALVQTYMSAFNYMPSSTLYEETKLVCKNIRNLEVVTSAPIYEEYDLKICRVTENDEEDELLTISFCLKALDIFFSTYGRLPGCQDDQVETDIGKLKECAKQIVGKMLNRLKTLDQCLYEICRYGGAELHGTSAFLGGCVGQEVIKLITNQYMPVNDTLVYDAMTASTRSFSFKDTYVTL